MDRRKRISLTVVGVLILSTLGVVSGAGPVTALVDSSTPASGWRPSGGIVYSMTRAGDMIVLGGTFTQMVSPTGTTAPRSRIAAISASTGALLPWAPNPNGDVRALTASADGQMIYVGGTFTNIAGVARTNLAAISPSGALIGSFAPPAPNNSVRRLLLHDGGLFIGGTFTRMGTTARGGGAESDPATGTLRGWNPGTNWGVYAIAPTADGTGIWVGGPFTSLAGNARPFVAKVSRASGAPLPWTSGSTCQDTTNPCVVYDITTDDSSVLLAIGGPGGRIAALDAETGVQSWWSGGDGDFQTVIRDGDVVYGGGHFASAVNGVSRAGLVALSRFTGAVLAEVSTLVLGGSGVWDILLDGDVFRFAGQFSSVGGVQVGRYSSFPLLSNPVDSTPPAAPGTPRAPAILADLVSLSWTASTDNVATIQYRIIRDGRVVGTSPVPLYKDATVAPSTTYSYTVAALDAAGNVSAVSRSLSVTTEAATSTLLSRGASWRFWSRGTDPGTGWTEAGFNDTGWAAGSGEFGFGDGDEATYVSPLGIVHYFRTSFDVADPSKVSQASIRLLVDDGAVVYLNGSELTRVNMPAGTVTNSTAASTGINGSAEMAYQTISVPMARLLQGRNQLAVSVHNNATTSSDISFDLLIPAQLAPAAIAPATPADLTATPAASAIALAWNAVAGAESYVIRRDGAPVGATTTTAFTDIGLLPDTSYTYDVASVNAVGTSMWTPPLAVTTLPEPPLTPAGLHATETTASSIALLWEPSAGATGYVITRGGTELPAVTTTSYVDTGLDPSTTYAYTIRAVNAGGSSSPSTPVSANTSPSAPGKTGNLVASEVTSDAVTISWNATVTATLYRVSRNGIEIAAVTSTTYTDTGLVPNTEYTFSVVAENDLGIGPASSPLAVTTLPEPPEVPQNLTVTASTASSVSLSWNGVPGATDYLVSRDGSELPPVTAEAFTDSGLNASSTYTYIVRARNAGGLSAPCPPVAGTTSSSPISVYTASGDTWRVNDSGADLGTLWRTSGYGDATWKSGPTEIGYGDGDEATVMAWGSNATQKPITNYMRRTFDAGASIGDVTSLRLHAIVDDGAIVYLNGQEIWRYNMPSGTITFNTRATTAISGAAERQWLTATIPVQALQPGINLLAVEVHNDAPSSSDVSFNFEFAPMR